MSQRFDCLDDEQFAEVLGRFHFSRHINIVHVHHTWRPNHAQYRGRDSIESMWRHHTQENGWRDIAQHVSIGPDGSIWTGRNWNLPPASAAGHNGNSTAGPFMIEVIGDFDTGKDKLEGAQKKALLTVICDVQRRFALAPTAVMFHNMMSPKTCPGSAVDFAGFLAEIDKEHKEIESDEELAARGRRSLDPKENERVNGIVARLTTRLPASRGDESNAEHGEQDDFALQARQRGGGEVAHGLTTEMLEALAPHVINLRGGRFSSGGLVESSEASVKALVDNDLAAALETAKAKSQPLRLMLYAHGGLVSESSGLKTAHKQLAWWKANGVFPIFFIWETGLMEIIVDLLKKTREEGRRNFFSDRISDPIIEMAMRALPMETIWRGMKTAARNASEKDGGAHFTAGYLKKFCDQHKNEIELHATGHSAGSIFHSHFLPVCKSAGLPPFRTVQFLAPAVRNDLFLKSFKSLVGSDGFVNELTVYTMRRDLERDDHCGHIYRKSLLYLVSASAEPESDAAILGLEDSLREDPDTSKFFGLGSSAGQKASIEFSKSDVTRATSHGGFDDDEATMNSVLRKVLGEESAESAVPFLSQGTGDRGMPDEFSVDWPDALQPRPSRSPISAGGRAVVNGRGKKHALCIGINEYRQQPLTGCVNDAEAWGAWLSGKGFSVNYLRDHEATAAGIQGGIEGLLTQASPGDVVVVQYAGHGTQIEDQSGDEGDDGFDEAWVPHDYHAGEFVIDDMLGEMFDLYRDRNVELVLFTDCCHSGSSTRAAFSPNSPVLAANSRYLPIPTELQREFNAKHPGRVLAKTRSAALGWEIHFAACQDFQSAYEENGSGNFTRAALGILESLDDSMLTYGSLADALRQAFANDARQMPNFRARPERRALRLFAGMLRDGQQPSADGDGKIGAVPALNATLNTRSDIDDRLEGITRRLDELIALNRR
jgi:hypothetical protein